MLSREQRNPLSDWWWTVDRLQLAAIIALILVIPQRGGRHPGDVGRAGT